MTRTIRRRRGGKQPRTPIPPSRASSIYVTRAGVREATGVPEGGRRAYLGRPCRARHPRGLRSCLFGEAPSRSHDCTQYVALTTYRDTRIESDPSVIACPTPHTHPSLPYAAHIRAHRGNCREREAISRRALRTLCVPAARTTYHAHSRARPRAVVTRPTHDPHTA